MENVVLEAKNFDAIIIACTPKFLQPVRLLGYGKFYGKKFADKILKKGDAMRRQAFFGCSMMSCHVNFYGFSIKAVVNYY